MCDKAHNYTVEIIGGHALYSDTDAHGAIAALLSIDQDAGEEGYVVAEHETGIVDSNGPGSGYCPAESDRIETEAIRIAVAASEPAA